ncbi:MAG: helix-turn-helix transcriptional regulator [Proteobacteria bacterium]|nr:helix-turn-helix transcriptional regulator [Pseudomonadota bacterium]MBU1451743.1 helix-turn-helix transcriptional regulator [Pseudomonadota bacterium]MBU2470645.1 helix-turn-helix transcriptional regulator [Pseudomonadota bacterium]MBU2517563.1 helix-turn-helix transcriptional regulator [Pseudomonadota bacterium]
MNLEQKGLAVGLRTSQSQLSRIEAGTTAPTLYHLLTIKVLADQNEHINGSLSWSWLLEGKGNIFEN